MPKRLLNMSASDFAATSPMDLKQAILASEGRTIMAETYPLPNFSAALLMQKSNVPQVPTCFCLTRSMCSIQLLPVFQMISMKTRSLG